MVRAEYTTDTILTLLADSPRRIAEVTEGLTPEQLGRRIGQDTWSIIDILAHLRACSDRWGGDIVTILAKDNPTIRAISPRTWMRETNSPDLKFRPSFESFGAQRAELLTTLASLSPEQWARSATVLRGGRSLERTVWDLAEQLANHERGHVEQINQVVDALRDA